MRLNTFAWYASAEHSVQTREHLVPSQRLPTSQHKRDLDFTVVCSHEMLPATRFYDVNTRSLDNWPVTNCIYSITS